MVLSDGSSYFSRSFHGTYVSYGYLYFGFHQRLNSDRLGTERRTSYTFALEADDYWNVEELRTGPSLCEGTDLAAPKLVYRKYRGPHRENLAWGQPKWNVFPTWRNHCPKALEAAECSISVELCGCYYSK